MPSVPLPRLHLVTDDRILLASDLFRRLERVLSGAGSRVALHLRGPGTSGRRLWEIGKTILPLCREAGVPLLVNDRVDLALVLGSAGAHLGGRSLPAGVARQILGADRLLGLSVHGPEGVAAGEGVVDFLFAGSAFPTRSHPGLPPIGLEGVQRTVVAARGLPVLAIGGIDEGRIPDVLAAGAYGIALIGAVWDAKDPGGAAASLLDRIADSLQSSGIGGQKG